MNGDAFDLADGPKSIFEDSLEDTLTRVASESRLDTALFNADQFKVILSALENNNEVELVSNPTVVTMNNTVAQINIGEEFPIPEYRYNEERGTFEVAGFLYKPIGILLNVVPQVNAAGFINLAIKPEISSRTGEVNFGGAGGAFHSDRHHPQDRKQRDDQEWIHARDRWPHGKRRPEKRKNKVPLLGDIPFLGRMFPQQHRYGRRP